MNIQEERAHAMALAGGAIVGVLLETLVEKKVLTVEEVRSVLMKSINGMAPYAQTKIGYEATGMIASLMRDRFPQERRSERP